MKRPNLAREGNPSGKPGKKGKAFGLALVARGRQGIVLDRPALGRFTLNEARVMASSMPRLGILLMALLLIASGGCRQGTAPLSPVRGKVSYQGSLLPGGLIVFTPDSSKGNHGEMAFAEIQADGTFSLKTGDLPGAVGGWHRVTIAAVRSPAAVQGSQVISLPTSLLPDKYRDPHLSGLVCEVKGDKANTIDFHLE